MKLTFAIGSASGSSAKLLYWSSLDWQYDSVGMCVFGHWMVVVHLVGKLILVCFVPVIITVVFDLLLDCWSWCSCVYVWLVLE
jgi:flagellar biosynthesis protein FlhB